MSFWERLHELGGTELAPGATRRERDRAGLLTMAAVVGAMIGLVCLVFGVVGAVTARPKRDDPRALTVAEAIARGETLALDESTEALLVQGSLEGEDLVTPPHGGPALLAGELTIAWRGRVSGGDAKIVPGVRWSAAAKRIFLAGYGARIPLRVSASALPLEEDHRPRRLVEVESKGAKSFASAVAFTYAGERHAVDREAFEGFTVRIDTEFESLASGETAVAKARILKTKDGPILASPEGKPDLNLTLGTLAEIKRRRGRGGVGMIVFGLLALAGAGYAWTRARKIRAGWAERAQ